MGWAPSLGTAQSPCLSKALGPHANTFRKLFPAESCFELSIIIFLAISDPDKVLARTQECLDQDPGQRIWGSF